ncbi:MAG: DMT family transporter [Chloroflexota bacterium]|nr:DMT family transporter [Chloroflexota bacterium]
MHRQLWADGLLAVVTLIWGSTFVLVKDTVEQVPVMTFLAARFAVGGLVLASAVLLLRKWRGLTLRELGWGGIIGAALWAGYAFQTLGLQGTTASKAGFITGLSVVLVPVLGLFLLRHRPGTWAWLGIALATSGLALLSLRLDERLEVSRGDLLVLGCAAAFATHIVLIARVPWADPLRLTTVQVIIAGLLNALSAVLFGQQVSQMSQEVWASVLFLGIAATALAFVVQVSVQRFTTATHTALIFTLEPVFAAIFGWWLDGDVLMLSGWAGAALILTGMLVTELLPYLAKRNAAT